MLLRLDNGPREHDFTKAMWGHALHGPKMDTITEPRSLWQWLTRSAPVIRHELHCLGHGSVREGDTILVAMQSGRVARFIVRKISYFTNPDDMFELERADFVEYVDDADADPAHR